MHLTRWMYLGPILGVRVSILARGLRFDWRLMVGTFGVGGEDTEFVDRAVAAGTKIGFAPTAGVRQIMQGYQVTLGIRLVSWFYRHGRQMYFFDWLHGKTGTSTIGGIPRYLIRRIGQRCVLLPFVLASFDTFRIVSNLRLIAYELGAARQSRLMDRGLMQPGHGAGKSDPLSGSR